MSDFFLQTAIAQTPEQIRRDYEALHEARLWLQASIRELERKDPLARRFDCGEFARY